MNVRPGGAQPCMHDTVWAGKAQKIVDENGVPKGMKGTWRKYRKDAG